MPVVRGRDRIGVGLIWHRHGRIHTIIYIASIVLTLLWCELLGTGGASHGPKSMGFHPMPYHGVVDSKTNIYMYTW
jgi:hypothetical protein